ncbi:MAG TPA: FAD-binding oxidoreductase [Candidatus Eremiobacteraceae bacterium]|nr:FAD-binding oxidoreductase [Candidatus Eremiobacteraceae bacterium]
MIERSYWLDAVGDLTTDATSEMPKTVDVAVIGAGFTGLSAARALAMRGASVAVIEAHHAGWGASSRNGGMVLTGLKQPASALVGRFGIGRARQLFDASLRSIDCVERVVREESIECDFNRCGHAEVACKPRHFDAMRKEAELLSTSFGHPMQVVDRGHLGTLIASDAYHGAVVDVASARIDPARYAFGLAAAAKRRGAGIVQDASVTAIHRIRGAGYTIATERGELRATKVLVATGAYTGAASASIARRVIAVGSYVIATEQLEPSRASALIPSGRMIFDSNNFLHYYRLTPDRRLLFGGRAAFCPADERTVRDSAEILRKGMTGVFPQLRDARIDYAWGGSIDFAFDMLPHAGVHEGLYYALGYAGHGVAMATYLGERIAVAMAGGGKAEEALDTGPLPAPPPGITGSAPWFLPIAGAWYRLLDWAS